MRTSRAGMVAFVAGLGVLAGVPAAHAAAGDLDPGFGSGGIVMTSYTGPFPADAALQPDGKIVVTAGFDNDPSATEAFGVLRYQGSNGALDTAFGHGGRATAAFTSFLNSPSDLALQPDGKVVVVGNAESADGTVSEFAVARFTPNGTLDGSFGAGGKVTTNFVGVKAGGVSNPAGAVLIQADGKILVGGLASACARCPAQSALARYNPDGTLDAAFGRGGMVAVTAIGGITALAEDAADHIFALGGASTAEFSPAGALLPQVTPAPIAIASSRGTSSAFQADGKYLAVAAGAGFSRHDIDAEVIRHLPTGAVDPAFTNPAFDFSADNTVASDVVQALAVQPDGKVIAAGLRSANGSTAFAVARLNPGGSLDPAFGTGGTRTLNLPAGGQASVVLIQPDGKILVIGQGFIPGGGVSLILARFVAR